MIEVRIAIVANITSIVIVAWMYMGGLVTYAPGISANAMQNIYLSRILWYGSTVIILQIATIGVLLRFVRSP